MHTACFCHKGGGTCRVASLSLLRNLSISLWSYATLGYKTMNLDVFMRETAVQAIFVKRLHFIDHDKQYKNVDPNIIQHDPTVIVHRCSLFPCHHLLDSPLGSRNLFHHMTQIITERIKSFACQGIANVVWALAKFQFQQLLGLWKGGNYLHEFV